MSDVQEPATFERALARIEEIVRSLEEGSVGLEEAVTLFEEGQRHLAVCRERLAAAQGRIDELTARDLPADPDEPPAEPFQ